MVNGFSIYSDARLAEKKARYYSVAYYQQLTWYNRATASEAHGAAQSVPVVIAATVMKHRCALAVTTRTSSGWRVGSAALAEDRSSTLLRDKGLLLCNNDYATFIFVSSKEVLQHSVAAVKLKKIQNLLMSGTVRCA